MSLTILTPDTLRKQVEAASKGQNTVHYTAKGQPSYFYVMPSFNDSVTGALHPAFQVAKADGSGNTVKAEYFHGMYPSVVRNGELLSLPGVVPTVNINFDQAVAYALACNSGAITGHHVANNTETSAVQQACQALGFSPRGNTDYGRSSDNPTERGVAATGTNAGRLAAATGTVTNATLTGSGPSGWRHNNSPFGIADLCGNVWEWSPGVRINSGEINIISFDGTTIANPALASLLDLAATSIRWYAINGATGALMAATLGAPVAGSVRYGNANSGTADYTLYRAAGGTFEGMVNSTGANPVGTTALNLVKTHGLYPISGSLGGDGFWIDVTGEKLPYRFGSWSNAGLSGLGALGASGARAGAGDNIGVRPGFVLP